MYGEKILFPKVVNNSNIRLELDKMIECWEAETDFILTRYRVIQKKVTIGIFSIMETTLNRNFFAIEITDQKLSLSKF